MNKRTTLCALVLGALAGGIEEGRAAAGAGPSFSNPLEITNPFFPLPPLGATMAKQLAADDGTWELVVTSNGTRTFELDGQSVEAREVFELEFLWEWLIEISANYYAQADDGTVYYFGEVVHVVRPAIAGEELSWLVGGPTLPGDPPDALVADAPATFMPAAPAVGMTWNPEDLAPELIETAVCVGTDATYTTDFGVFAGCLVLFLHSDGDDKHVKLYAPGFGEVYTSDREVEHEIVGFRQETY